MQERLIPEIPSPVNPESQRDIFSVVKQEVSQLEQTGLFHRTLPALHLYAYNFFSKHPTPDKEQLDTFTRTCKEVNEIETRHIAKGDLLPTVGAEIEWFIPKKHREVLDKLGIKPVPANDEDPNGPLWEIPLPWTYSANTQAYMVKQLKAMGVLDPAYKEGNPATRIGLHLNFAAPPDVSSEQLTNWETRAKIEDLNDALILAHVSETRLRERKTRKSYTTDKEIEASQRMKTPNIVYRLELRALECLQDEKEMDRLFLESQYLATGLFQWIRMPTLTDTTLPSLFPTIAEHFTKFSGKVHDLKDKYSIVDNFADISTSQLAVSPLSNKRAVRAFRTLVRQSSNTIKDLLDRGNP